jgi:hypothetical protein
LLTHADAANLKDARPGIESVIAYAFTVVLQAALTADITVADIPVRLVWLRQIRIGSRIDILIHISLLNRIDLIVVARYIIRVYNGRIGDIGVYRIGVARVGKSHLFI